MKPKWENVTRSEYTTTARMMVLGGWILRSSTYIVHPYGATHSQSMVFISDPGHEWSILDIPDDLDKNPDTVSG